MGLRLKSRTVVGKRAVSGVCYGIVIPRLKSRGGGDGRARREEVDEGGEEREGLCLGVEPERLLSAGC
eukprot:699432-Rhodomonas_salina.2